MSLRDVDILHAIVEAYIANGEPVASRAISKGRHDCLSAATVRNVMADLCDAGYLSQPHTSAGRVPTEKAFRSYVRTLAAGRVLSMELQRLRQELSRAETMEARMERSCLILTEMTRGVGIAAAIPGAGQTLEQVELVSLPDRRVLMIVVTQDGMVRNRVLALQETVTPDELNSIRNYLNQHFRGWLLPQIRLELQRRLREASAAYDEVLKRLTLLQAKGLLDLEWSPQVHMEGASNLVGLDLHLTREKMRDLFQTLEEKKRVLELLDRFLEQPKGELCVKVGLSEAHPSMGELSLIGVTVELPGGLHAKVAVLGSMRMDYGRVMSAVLHMGQAFQSLPG